LVVAKKSPLQRRIGWRVDRWTDMRIRIGKILARNPDIIGREVMEKLGPDCPRIQWVWYVMQQFRRGSAKPTRK
jgi:hypothetical protein